MGHLTPTRTPTHLALLRHPYEDVEYIDMSWAPAEVPAPGYALAWWLADADAQEREFQWLYERPPGLPLLIVLPPAREIRKVFPLLGSLTALDPRAILPAGRLAAPNRLRDLLATPPRRFADAVSAYLARRGLLRTEVVRRNVRSILEAVPAVRSVSGLAARLHSSRRTLGRRFADAGLPVPSHWLQFARILHVAMRLQIDKAPLARIAAQYGYPDAFTLSNQMKRLTDFRPTDVRRWLGWEWIVEAWLKREAESGGLALELHGYTVWSSDRKAGDVQQ